MKRRTAMKHALPYEIKDDDWQVLLEERFDGKCMLTGKKKKVSLEHMIPLSIGHGGTTIYNCIPMDYDLNVDKAGQNPFKWIKSQKPKVQEQFYKLVVPYLATMNGMDTETYKKYVYWCFQNPRKVKEVRKDTKAGKSSIMLFYESLNE